MVECKWCEGIGYAGFEESFGGVPCTNCGTTGRGVAMKIPVDDCPAGPEMDAACAEAMGWKPQHDPRRCDGEKFIKCGACGASGHGNCYGNGMGQIQIKCGEHVECCEEAVPPAYSVRIEHAWELVESDTWPEDWLIGKPTQYSKGYWAIVKDWGYQTENIMAAETAPLAISRAFLKARGVTEIEVPE